MLSPFLCLYMHVKKSPREKESVQSCQYLSWTITINNLALAPQEKCNTTNAAFLFFFFLHSVEPMLRSLYFSSSATESIWIREKVEVQLLLLSCFSRVQLFVTPWSVAQQAPLSMGFSRQEYWSGWPYPALEDLLDPHLLHCGRILYCWTMRKPRMLRNTA